MEFPNDDQNPYAPPDLAESSEGESVLAPVGEYREQKLRQLIWMVVLFAVMGFISAPLEEHPVASSIVDLATSVGFVVLILRWCSLDREELGLEAWPFFALMMLICPGPLILMPIYFCATRGAWGLVSSLIAAGFLFLLVLVTLLTTFLGYWATDQMV